MQSLIPFREAALVKANITISFCGFTLEWLTLKLSNFDCDVLNNDPRVKSLINILSNCFKILMSISLNFLTNEIYFLNDTQIQHSPAQYIQAIICHKMGYNIIDIANQLLFAYYGIAPKI